ncbi:MAG: bifunctional adenosylcobinamide kinase/adenosylcobinamide-phosphate guanylyltransferase [Nitrospirae bacterium]|nr:bifunctional adenosylcobinamide kinase/adenosylcobinamide-phosphate guanylyltransferase [Nitrospirota bacterium]
MKRKIIFIIGGARSGKSDFALEEASGISGKKAYIATAEALDEEMRERIEEHKKKRGEDWDTYEEPLKISEVIKKIGGKYEVIILDCLTLWLSNLMQDNCNSDREIENLIDTLEGSKLQAPNTELFIVSNEVGMGIVPENEIARRFRDMAGILNQKVAEISDEVYLIAAGIPVKIKG